MRTKRKQISDYSRHILCTANKLEEERDTLKDMFLEQSDYQYADEQMENAINSLDELYQSLIVEVSKHGRDL